eukprot:scaffold19060_cov62-Phaeocystis_antarctica.AAC.12
MRTKVPATMRTMLYRKPSPSSTTARPGEVPPTSVYTTSQRCRVRTVVLRPPLLWKDLKSWVPTSWEAARRMAGRSRPVGPY